MGSARGASEASTAREGQGKNGIYPSASEASKKCERSEHNTGSEQFLSASEASKKCKRSEHFVTASEASTAQEMNNFPSEPS